MLPSDMAERRARMRLLFDELVAAMPAEPTPKPGYPIGSFPKRCGCCGRIYAAAEWGQLPDAHSWDLRPDGDLLEIRRCECRSTIAVLLEP